MKRATKRELIVVATMISRMIGNSVFSDQMGFSVATGAKSYGGLQAFSVLTKIPIGRMQFHLLAFSSLTHGAPWRTEATLQSLEGKRTMHELEV